MAGKGGYMVSYMYDDLVYETWVVDECGDAVMKCADYPDEVIEEYLEEHPEYSIRTLPLFM